MKYDIYILNNIVLLKVNALLCLNVFELNVEEKCHGTPTHSTISKLKMGFLLQLYVLLWKNYRIKLRRLVSADLHWTAL